MKLARYITAASSIGLILTGGVLKGFSQPIAPSLILIGFSILILGYIPVFILHISKKWDHEDRNGTDQSNSA